MDAIAGYRCDICGGDRARSDRHRLVWDTGLGTELVLAELCGQCTAQADRLIAVYGGHGRDSIRLTQADSVSARETTPVYKISGVVVRGFVYALIALTAFAVVTFVSARG